MAELEPILDPDLAIIDPHHHLWWWGPQALAALEPDNPLTVLLGKRARYMIEELVEDVGSGHNVIATYYAQNHFMYTAGAPKFFGTVGEVEYANGVGAMARSGLYGPTKVCAAILAGLELGVGAPIEDVLDKVIAAGNGRVCGVRSGTAYTDDPDLLGSYVNPPKGILNSAAFRDDARAVARRGLALDVWLLEPQLPEMIEFAKANPDINIVLDHCGSPVGVASYTGKLEERFPIWRDNIKAIAQFENVSVKLGGLGMPTCGFPTFNNDPPATSEQVAAHWRPYIETCIEAFGASRAMFESNFPVDSGVADYRTLWNVFKRIASGASADEKKMLFAGTVERVYGRFV